MGWPGSITPSWSTSRRHDCATALAFRRPGRGHRATGPPADWLRLARLARLLSWLTLAWMGIEGGVAIGAAVVAGSVALLGFGLDSGIEAMASVIVIWRFTGTRLASATSERRAQQLVAVSFFLLAPYIAVEATRSLATGERAETSVIGLVLTAGTAIFEPALGVAKRRIGARLGSPATAGEGTQNLLCAYLATAVFAGLAANTLLGAWWLDGVVALGIAGWAVIEGRRAWAGKSCGCAWPAGAAVLNYPGNSPPWPVAGCTASRRAGVSVRVGVLSGDALSPGGELVGGQVWPCVEQFWAQMCSAQQVCSAGAGDLLKHGLRELLDLGW